MVKTDVLQVSYEYLTVEEQMRMIEGQLLGLEREHFNLTQLMSTDPSGSSTGTNPGETRITWLESEMVRLRAYRDGLVPVATPTT